MLVVPVLECEVSVVLVSRSQNVNSQNSFGICLEWYKIPEPFDTCFKAPYFCSFWKISIPRLILCALWYVVSELFWNVCPGCERSENTCIFLKNLKSLKYVKNFHALNIHRPGNIVNTKIMIFLFLLTEHHACYIFH